MRFRFAEPKDMPQVEDLWDYCFEKREEDFFQYYFGQYNSKENKVYGAFLETDEGEKLQSMVHLNPYIVRINGQELELPYLVGVATAEEARGHHLMGEMLKHLFQEPELCQLPFVFLMPINAGIYLPYDFAFTHYRHEYKVPGRAVEPLKAGEGIWIRGKALELSDEAVLAPIYETYTAEYNGVNLRPHKQWEKLLTVCVQEGMQLVVAQKADKAVGYMLYHITDGTLEIFEMLYANTAVRNALLHQAASIAEQTEGCENIHWLAPAEDKTHLDFKDQTHSGSLAPFMMFRVINKEAAIKLCQGDRHLVTQKCDTSVPTLSEKTTFMDMLNKLPIASLTQLLMGTFSATELWEEGKIKDISPEELTLLGRVFPKKKNWINEYF